MLKILSTRHRENSKNTNTTLFFVGPTKDQGFFSQEKQRLFASQNKGLTQTGKEHDIGFLRHFDFIFLYFLTLAVFSDGKFRRLKPIPKKNGGRKTQNQNLAGKRYLFQSRKGGKQTTNKKKGCYERTRPRKDEAPARALHRSRKGRYEGKICYPKPSPIRRIKEERPPPKERKPGPNPIAGAAETLMRVRQQGEKTH